jgi:hypothetical protein
MVTSVSRQSYPAVAMEAVIPVVEKSLAGSLQTIETSHRARSGSLTTSLTWRASVVSGTRTR